MEEQTPDNATSASLLKNEPNDHKRNNSKKELWRNIFISIVIGILVFLVVWFALQQQDETCVVVDVVSTATTMDQDICTGHKILHHVLVKEEELKYLQILQRTTSFFWSLIHRAAATPSSIPPEFQRLVTRLHETSSQRKLELERLWKKSNMRPYQMAPISRIGDSIQDQAEGKGTIELISGLFQKDWHVRFLALQTQATRMVSSIALATAQMEEDNNKHNNNNKGHTTKKNPRSLWLRELNQEYESLREQCLALLDIMSTKK